MKAVYRYEVMTDGEPRAHSGHPGVVGTYVGTAVTPGGALVWHLFELDGNRS